MMADELLSAQDLITAKKHDTFHSEVITGKVGGVAGGASIDYATNAATGQVQKTMPAILRDLGFTPASFDFTSGGTLGPSDRDKSVLWPLASGGDGDWYYWEGALPKVIPPASSPASTGGVADGAWRPVGDINLREELASDAGAGLVSYKPSGVAGAVKRALSEVVYDQIIDAKWFGAKGDWDMGTQTGADDTAAIQAAIDFCALLGSRREGGLHGVRLSPGHYRYSHLLIPASIDFGFSMFSDAPGDATLWADQNVAGEAITCEAELTKFNNLNFIGALTDQLGGNLPATRPICFKGKLGWNYPDIDVQFTNCYMAYWQTFADIYGRGAVFENCMIVLMQRLMNIVADPSTIFAPSGIVHTVETGMRHYTLRNCRFDVVSVIIDITGTATQKDYINDILITSCDFAQCNILIRGTDAIIRRSTVTGNNGVACFKTGIVQVKAAKDFIYTSNNISNQYNDNITPTSDTITSILRTTEWIDGAIISGNITSHISGNIVQASTVSNNVHITDNHFPQAWTTLSGGNHYVYWSPTYCDGLHITGNTFSTANVNGSYFLFDGSVQTVSRTVVNNNSAVFPWGDARLRYTPKILVNGVQTAGAITAQGRYTVTENKVIVDFMVAGPIPEASGNISISLPPITAVPENATLSGSYSGVGSIGMTSNISATGASLLPIRINPSTQEAELFKSVNMTPARITIADRVNPVAVYGSFEYRR